MTAPLDPESVSSSPPPMVAQPVQITANSEGFSVQPISPFINKPVRRAGRTFLIAGVFLILLFFSPFVSCGASQLSDGAAFSGFTTFRMALGNPEETGFPKTGLVLIIFPLAGLVGALIGYLALQASTKVSELRELRAFSLVTLCAALLTICPTLLAFAQVAASEGILRLEWGFYLSVLAAIGLGVGAIDLLINGRKTSLSEPAGATVAPIATKNCPSCGAANPTDTRFCMQCGNSLSSG